jgi:hypothetical protein
MFPTAPVVVSRLALVVLFVLALGAPLASAQPADAPAACVRPAQACGDPTSFPGLVFINLVPNGQGGCVFEPRFIPDLDTDLGGDVRWEFCSECNADMLVQIDTLGAGDGPFDNFDQFTPPPSADNLVTVSVPCQGDGYAWGRDAQDGGLWKYSLSAKPVGAPTFPDVIDPKLEIDEYRVYLEWAARLGLMVLGGMAGAFIARRLRASAAR